jgi:error-prone DNA polymerase
VLLLSDRVPPSPDRLRCASPVDLSPQAGRGEEGEADDWGDRIVAARERRPFTSLEEFARDTKLPKRALILLADADAFRSLGLDRRAALWAVRRLPDDVPLPLFVAATAREQPDEHARPLPEMPLPEQVVADYQTVRLSLKGHPMQFLRRRGAGAAAARQRQGRRVHDAGR